MTMEPGTILIWTAFITALLSIFFSILTLITKKDLYRRVTRLMSLLVFGFLSFILILILYYFLSLNLDIHFIWENTDSNYEWYYRISGLWKGLDGTLLLWTWLIAISLAVEEFIGHRKNKKDHINTTKNQNKVDTESSILIFDWIRLITLILLVAFIGLIISTNLFEPTQEFTILTPTDPDLKQIYFNPVDIDKEINFEFRNGTKEIVDPKNPPQWAVNDTLWIHNEYDHMKDGKGFNYVLLTPLMIFHPPVEFAAYAFTALLLTSAFAFLITGNRKWTDVSLRWGRMAWLFYTLGLGLGAIWAYVVLGWGGFWAWDPVETGNLIPWIALTAFLHALIRNRNGDDFRYLTPLLAITVFVLTLLTRFITTSGMWQSVHSFGSYQESLMDPALRLINIIEINESAKYFFIMIMGILIIALLLISLRFLKDRLSDVRFNKTRSVTMIIPLMLYIIFLMILLCFIFIDIHKFISWIADISITVGNGNYILGLVLLCVAVTSIPIGWMIFTSDDLDKDEDDRYKDKKNDRVALPSKTVMNKYTMYITVAILSLSVIATIIILLLGVNGLRPEDFNSKAPYIILPLLWVMVICQAWSALGKINTLYVLGLIIFWNIGGFILYPASSTVGIGLPILIIALGISGYKIIHVVIGDHRDKETNKNDRMRIAGLLLILAGIIGMFTWSSGIDFVSMFLLEGELSPVWNVFGFILALIALIAGISALQFINYRLVIFGGICGILAIGMFISTIFSSIALMLVYSSRTHFIPSPNYKRLKLKIRPLSAHLIHFSVILILLGYVASQFMTAEELIPLLKGEEKEFNGYRFKFVAMNGWDTDDNITNDEIIEATIEISKNGERLGLVPLTWEYVNEMGHYVSEVSIKHTVVEDIYFDTSGSYYAIQGNWTLAINTTSSVKFNADDIQGVGFYVKIIPLMSFVWGGFWIAVTGIALRITVDYLPSKQFSRKMQ